MALLVVSLSSSMFPTHRGAAAAPVRPDVSPAQRDIAAGALVSLMEVSGRTVAPRQVAQPSVGIQSCVPSSAVASPTPTATITPTPTGTPPPSPTPVPTPTFPPGVPTPTPIPTALQTSCAVSASPALAFNPIGREHTFTFLCGASAALLTGPARSPYPTTGCFDVVATVNDITMGGTANITFGLCAGQPVAPTPSINCTGVQNPICAAGMLPSGGTCILNCPAGFSPIPAGCSAPPVAGVCPAGSTPVLSTRGLILYCLTSPITAPTPQNEVTVSFESDAPHAYMIDVTGYVGTTPAGTCPEGTTFVPEVTLASPPGAPPVTGPACSFNVAAEKKYLEATHLTVIPQGPCGEATTLNTLNQIAGPPCFFTVTATGSVILKVGVDCSNGTEPATGTDATPGGFPPGSVYECVGSVLSVVNVPMPHVPIEVTATNGFFAPTCLPEQRLTTPTPTPTGTLTPTATATATNTPVASPTPTAAGTGTTSSGVAPPGRILCGGPGISTIQTFTDNAGIAGVANQEVEYGASVVPPATTPGSSFTILGAFQVDGTGLGGVPMYSTIHYPSLDRTCDSVTGPDGIARCTTQVPTSVAPGTTVPVDVTFIYNCTQYSTRVSFRVVGPGTATPTPAPTVSIPLSRAAAPPGICVVRTGFGPLTVTATFTSQINTQPSISSGPVTLGVFTLQAPTSTPVPTPGPPTATPVPTSTPAPTPTPIPTSVPTSSPTPTLTPTPSPTPTLPPPPTATPRPPLRFTLNAARVSNVAYPANKQGVDSVQHGQTVYLFIYYTVQSIPRNEPGVSTYQILSGNRVIYAATYTFTQHTTDPRSNARYTSWIVPRDLPYGVYTFQGTLRLDGQTQARTWTFSVVRQPSEPAPFSWTDSSPGGGG